MNGPTRVVPCSACRWRCDIAQTLKERDQVYQLRHEAYRRDGAIDPQPGDRFSDHFDTLPNSFSILVRQGDTEAKATVRLSVVRQDLGWSEAPSRRVFGGHPALESMVLGGYVEASRLCFGAVARRDAFVKLLGHMGALSDIFATEWLVACPRVEHAQVYQRLFGFRQLAEPRQYFGVRFLTQLLGVRREEIRHHVRGQNCMGTAWNEALAAFQSLPAPVGAAAR